ncbi:NADH-quinone oxidoreductase subunit C [Fundidesulfovibrio butyratiphilus]
MLHMTPGEAVSLGRLPVLSASEFRETLVTAVRQGSRLSSFFAWGRGPSLRLIAIVANDCAAELTALSCEPGERFASITPECPQAHLFEREIHEQSGLPIDGHPWFKPVRSNAPFGAEERPAPCVGQFFTVAGEDVHEVSVGPIHAGVIEPGHFRFQCHGEDVFHLEIALGYQHRGVEERLAGGPDTLTVHLFETLAGDTTVGHTTAYAQVAEALAGVTAPPRAAFLRAAALELERLANHTGDLGAMAGDVGYLPVMSFNGRLRGDYLNLSALLCGNRFGRGMVVPGGVGFDADSERLATLRSRLEAIFKDTSGSASLLFDCTSVRARFEHTGQLTALQARDLGLVGPPARACGLARDVRADWPCWALRGLDPRAMVDEGGDVQARAAVRWLEMRESVRLVRALTEGLPEGPVTTPLGPLAPDSLAVSLVEGWRGEICHTAITGPDGRLVRYKIVDPSFHNWSGLALALRGQQISDFPLCNKSFNLSYCGHDL